MLKLLKLTGVRPDLQHVERISNFFKLLKGRDRKRIMAALINPSGTLYAKGNPTPGAIDALNRLRKEIPHLKFVTNTKQSCDTLYNRLVQMGFELEKREIYSSLNVTANYIRSNKLNPFYLVSRDARNMFPPEISPHYDSVVVGLAPIEFDYDDMGKAFKILLKNKEKKNQLIGIHQDKYYQQEDGPALGPGFIIKGLEFATSTNAILFGKKNRYFFESAIPNGLRPDECVMIGDDPNNDSKMSLAVGMKSILVKTDKYLPNIALDPPPNFFAANFADAVDWMGKKGNKI